MALAGGASTSSYCAGDAELRFVDGVEVCAGSEVDFRKGFDMVCGRGSDKIRSVYGRRGSRI